MDSMVFSVILGEDTDGLGHVCTIEKPIIFLKNGLITTRFDKEKKDFSNQKN
jgi:hypothetical protein